MRVSGLLTHTIILMNVLGKPCSLENLPEWKLLVGEQTSAVFECVLPRTIFELDFEIKRSTLVRPAKNCYTFKIPYLCDKVEKLFTGEQIIVTFRRTEKN